MADLEGLPLLPNDSRASKHSLLEHNHEHTTPQNDNHDHEFIKKSQTLSNANSAHSLSGNSDTKDVNDGVENRSNRGRDIDASLRGSKANMSVTGSQKQSKRATPKTMSRASSRARLLSHSNSIKTSSRNSNPLLGMSTTTARSAELEDAGVPVTENTESAEFTAMKGSKNESKKESGRHSRAGSVTDVRLKNAGSEKSLKMFGTQSKAGSASVLKTKGSVGQLSLARTSSMKSTKQSESIENASEVHVSQSGSSARSSRANTVGSSVNIEAAVEAKTNPHDQTKTPSEFDQSQSIGESARSSKSELRQSTTHSNENAASKENFGKSSSNSQSFDADSHTGHSSSEINESVNSKSRASIASASSIAKQEKTSSSKASLQYESQASTLQRASRSESNASSTHLTSSEQDQAPITRTENENGSSQASSQPNFREKSSLSLSEKTSSQLKFQNNEQESFGSHQASKAGSKHELLSHASNGKIQEKKSSESLSEQRASVSSVTSGEKDSATSRQASKAGSKQELRSSVTNDKIQHEYHEASKDILNSDAHEVTEEVSIAPEKVEITGGLSSKANSKEFGDLLAYKSEANIVEVEVTGSVETSTHSVGELK
jgi:hypothetical protein